MRIKSAQKFIDKLRGKNKAPLPEAFSRPLSIEDISREYFQNWMHYSMHTPKYTNYLSVFEKAPEYETSADTELYKKLKTAIVSRLGKNEDTDDIWQSFIVGRHKDFYEAIRNNDDKKAINMLNHMFENDLSYGYEITLIEEVFKNNPKIELSNHALHMSTLLAFAEYLGLIPVENMEQNVWGEYLKKDPDEIIDLIEKELGFEIKFPKFKTGLYSIKTKRGYFTNRDWIYIYIALKIKEWCGDNPKICEIGGGCGYLAYYLDMLGIKDITIVDIPTTSNPSAWFLMKNMPHRNVKFETDENINSDTDSIKLIIPECFHDIPENIHFDLILNCDSFPEINKSIVLGYLDKISNLTNMFYSVNQEAKATMWGNKERQNSVPELIKEINKGYKRLSRNLFWLRRGYVEELYKIEKE